MGRQSHLDSIAGFLIIYMIYTHIMQLCDMREDFIYRVLQFVLSFFMVWFFYKAGMFHHTIDIRKTAKRLLIPFLCFSFAGHVVFCFHLFIEGGHPPYRFFFSPIRQIIENETVSGNLALWFLPALFFTKVIASYLLNSRIWKSVLVLLFLALSLWVSTLGITKPVAIINLPLCLLCYTIGYFLREIQYNKLFCGACLILFSLSIIYYPSIVDVRTNSVKFGSYFSWLIYVICACCLVNNLFRMIPMRHLKWIQSIGTDSMTYYVVHWPVIYFVYIVCAEIFHLSDHLLLIIMVCVSCITLPLLNKLINKSTLLRVCVGKG